MESTSPSHQGSGWYGPLSSCSAAVVPTGTGGSRCVSSRNSANARSASWPTREPRVPWSRPRHSIWVSELCVWFADVTFVLLSSPTLCHPVALCWMFHSCQAPSRVEEVLTVTSLSWIQTRILKLGCRVIKVEIIFSTVTSSSCVLIKLLKGFLCARVALSSAMIQKKSTHNCYQKST